MTLTDNNTCENVTSSDLSSFHINTERNEQAVQLTPSTLEMTQQRPNALESQRGDADEVDDDDVTVIILDHFADDSMGQQAAIEWIERTGPEMEERRRVVLIRELRRIQRSSFFRFALLCLVPTVLLLVVIATVAGDDEECSSDVTYCELEPRTITSAFTARCVCDPIPVYRGDV
jgi:hypothetical protein